MTALGLLGAIRKANLHDDEARILLAVASGFRRYSDVAERTGLKETQLRKMLVGLRARDLLDVENAPRGAAGRGKCSVYSLTGPGISKVQEILSVKPEDHATRPIPAGITLTIAVKGGGLCFLQP